MRSSEQLSLPDGWRPVSRALLLLAVCSPVLVVLLLRSALPTIGTPAWAAGGAALAGSLLVLIGSYGLIRAQWRSFGIRSFDIDEKAGVTRVRYSREVVVLRMAAMAATAALFGLLGILAVRYSAVPVGILMFGFGLGFLGWLVAWWARGVRVGELLLGPTEVTVRVDSDDLVARWADVYWMHTWDATQRGATWRRIDIGAREVRGWTEPDERWWAEHRSSMPSVEVRCDRIDVDSLLLYSWLKFYVDNPDARGELGTPASLARAQTADFSY